MHYNMNVVHVVKSHCTHSTVQYTLQLILHYSAADKLLQHSIHGCETTVFLNTAFIVDSIQY